MDKIETFLDIITYIVSLSIIYYALNILNILFNFTGSYRNGDNFDYILIMGTDQGDELNRRLDDGILFHKKYSDKKIIVSGGKGENKSLTEAELMYNYLVNNGISKDNIIKEPKATTSYENLIFVRKLVEKDAKFVIISSPYHLLRIRIVATRLDFNCYTKASGIRTHISGILREPFALVICLLFKK